MKVAIVHDWLTGMRGGERCLELLCEMFPDADICTLLHIPGSVSPTIERHAIRTSFIQRLPSTRTRYRYYLPLFPAAIESFDLSVYDLILSSSHCVAKGVPVPHGARHLSYIYTPMRYIWDQYDSYFEGPQARLITRMAMRLLRRRLQRWDISSNRHVHRFIAISEHIANRVRKYYGRDADVVHPPVDWKAFQASSKDEGFYLMVTAFAPYKRVDLAIAAFNQLRKHLVVIGTGHEEKRLRAMAGPTVQFLGWQEDKVVRDYYGACRALVFPGEEDFGIVPLEAMASGKPVIAFGKGGVLETVNPLGSPRKPPTGIFFYEQNVRSLIEAIHRFEEAATEFDRSAIRRHVQPFDRPDFKEKMRCHVAETLSELRP
jgi:glycosyltransferase involved in cell wall biosynthesis